MGLGGRVDLRDAVEGQHGSLLIVAVGGAHHDGQRVHAGLVHKFLGFVYLGVFGADAVLGYADVSQFALHAHAYGMGALHHVFQDRHVFFKGRCAGVPHHAGAAPTQGLGNDFVVRAVIQMEGHFHLGVAGRFHDGGGHEPGLEIGEQTAVHLQDDAAVRFLGGEDRAQHGLSVVHVKSWNGAAFFLGNVQKSLHVGQHG